MAKKKLDRKAKDKKELRRRGKELAPLRSFLMGLGIGDLGDLSLLRRKVPPKGPHTKRIVT